MNTITLISFIFIGLGLIFFVISLFIRLNHRRGIRHYEKERDKLSEKEKEEEPEEEEEEGSGIGFISNLFGGFIAILIGITLFPAIAESVQVAINNSNQELAGQELVGPVLQAVPLLFALSIFIIGAVVITSSLKQANRL